jgi:hypothetical protein
LDIQSHLSIQEYQEGGRISLGVTYLQDSLLIFNSELVGDELNLHSKQAQQLEECATKHHNVYIALSKT